MAARMAMIATTIISSIRVKPCWLFFMVYPLGVVETSRAAWPGVPVRRLPCDTARARGIYAHSVPMRPAAIRGFGSALGLTDWCCHGAVKAEKHCLFVYFKLHGMSSFSVGVG